MRATRPSDCANTRVGVDTRQLWMAMPRAWEFQIEFDDKTGHISKVVYGDNTPYAEYIKAHNHATDASRAST